MKLYRASATDKAILYKQWKDAFAHDDGGSIDYYFNTYYDPTECYLLKEGESILSSLQVHRHTMVLHGKRISASYIVGVLTPMEYRRKGYMKHLMDEVLDMLSHQDLVTVLIPILSSQGIPYTLDPQEYQTFYKEFTKHFTGYFTREDGYYEKRFGELKAEGKKVLVLKEDGVVKGYCMFGIQPKSIDIEEILYVDALSCLKMISTLLNGKEKVFLHVSEHEELTRILPGSSANLEEYMSVRINDFDLFNKLYDTRVSSARQAMSLSGKPLWIHDSQ